MEEKKKAIDWDAMEPEWRAGVIQKKELSIKYGVSRAAIDKHWEKLGIGRDLKEKIRQEADVLVTRQQVTREVTQEQRVTEREIIECNAVLQATIRREQRTDISRSRKLVMSLLNELEEQTGSIELYQQLGEMMLSPDEYGADKLNEIYRKVIGLSSRTKTMKDLADSLKSLVALEREAFGIDDRHDLNKTQAATITMQF